MPLWFYLFLTSIVLKLADVLTTGYAVSIFGTEVEINPIMRNGMESFLGIGGTLFLSWAAVCLVTLYCVIRIPKKRWLGPAITCGIYLPVVINNVWQLYRAVGE
jgi:hypothetical protein